MKKVCFIASSGGHLEQINQLKQVKNKYDSFLVTTRTKATEELKEKHYLVKDLDRSNYLKYFFRLLGMFVEQYKIFRKEKPDYIVTTGAGVAIPMCLIARFFKKKVI